MNLTPLNKLKTINSWIIVPLILSFSILIVLNSCDDSVLDTSPFGQTSTNNFWSSANDAEAAINAAYAPLTSIWGHTITTLLNIPDDDMYRAGDHGDHSGIENFTYDASLGKINSSWRTKYEIIQRTNNILVNVPEIEMDQSQKNRILGEAHFLRAFSYWTLANLFGGVPLILEENVLNNEFNVPRATLEATYSQIESDLTEAVDLLPEEHTGSNIGRAHSGAAWGYLTALYMIQERFDDAIDAGSEVINGPYPLAENFDDNFKVETQYNPEILFTIGSSEGWQTQSQTTYTTPRPWGGWDFQAPLPDLIEEFEEGDPRLDDSILMPGDIIDLGGDRGPTEYTSDLSPTTGYHFQKWASWRSEGGLDYNMNLPMLRASEIYLYVAEAKIRSNENGDTELNLVRDRVGLDPINNATIDDIIHERRVELAGEQRRHYDLMRWDRANIVDIVAIYGEDRGAYDPPRTFVRPKHYFYAIPQNQIDISDGVLEQNLDH
ncbi:MAG: RagB/SusD family nutrient uptake outer membrane protein [Balneolaceae bacterium]